MDACFLETSGFFMYMWKRIPSTLYRVFVRMTVEILPPCKKKTESFREISKMWQSLCKLSKLNENGRDTLLGHTEIKERCRCEGIK